MSENSESEDHAPYEPPRVDMLGSFAELTSGTFVDHPGDQGSFSAD